MSNYSRSQYKSSQDNSVEDYDETSSSEDELEYNFKEFLLKVEDCLAGKSKATG